MLVVFAIVGLLAVLIQLALRDPWLASPAHGAGL
jgi:hypothetical protein